MAEDSGDGKEIDIGAGPTGVTARARGYRLIDLVWLPMIMGVGYLCFQQASAQSDKRINVEQVDKTHKEFIEVLKENNLNTVSAIKELAVEQRKSTTAIKEIACLSDPALRNKNDAREICKRLVRGDDR